MKLKKLLVLSTLVTTSIVLADPPPSVKEATKKENAPKAEDAKPAPPKAPVNVKATPAPEKPATPPMDPATAKKNSSYGFGYRAGREFGNQTNRFGLTIKDINKDAFMKGFFESYQGEESSIPEAEVNAAFTALQELVTKREKSIGEKNLVTGVKFLQENGKREGVVTTDSGLQYEIITKGDGKVYEVPAEVANGGQDRTQFMIKYDGTLIDGAGFDSSKGKTVPMGMSTVPGFKEALTQMPVGSTWKIFLKPELAYGASRRSPQIGPNSTLIFEVTLEDINVIPPPPSRAPGNRPTAVSPPVRVPLPQNKQGAASKSNQRPAMSKPIKVPARPKTPAVRTPAEGDKKAADPATSGPIKVPPVEQKKDAE